MPLNTNVKTKTLTRVFNFPSCHRMKDTDMSKRLKKVVNHTRVDFFIFLSSW